MDRESIIASHELSNFMGDYEAPMINKFAFEALDRSLQDIMGNVDINYSKLPFGGKTIVFGGDFRQILPVVPRGGRVDIVHATINSSYLWKKCIVINLTKNMRLQLTNDPVENKNVEEFAKWILDIGDGKIGKSENGEAVVEIPSDILLKKSSNLIGDIVNSVYPNLLRDMYLDNFFEHRAILAPTLDSVEKINEYVLELMLPGQVEEYLSCDIVSNCDKDVNIDHRWITTEFLNEIKCSGLPNYKLILKIGVPVMLMRNIDVSSGLCNGTRLKIIHLGKNVVGAEIVIGPNIGETVYLS